MSSSTALRSGQKKHHDIHNLGVFGLLGRANDRVHLCNKGAKGDDIPNMATAEEIVAANPLPEVPAPAPAAPRARGRGRPSKRRGRRGHRGMATTEKQQPNEL